MLICEVDDSTVLPPCLSNKGNSDGQNVKFLTIFTSDEAKFKAEAIFPDVPRMLRQKHAIINQISQITTRIKENTFEKVFCCFSFDWLIYFSDCIALLRLLFFVLET